jgi:hypothetical protein
MPQPKALEAGFGAGLHAIFEVEGTVLVVGVRQRAPGEGPVGSQEVDRVVHGAIVKGERITLP